MWRKVLLTVIALVLASGALFVNGQTARGSMQTGNVTAEAEKKPSRAALEQALPALKQQLLAKHGEAQRARIERGVNQVASLWRPSDGDASALASFALENFISDPALLKATFEHFEYAEEQIDGYLNEMGRELRHWTDLDVGPILPIDRVFSAWDPSAHVTDDLFDNKAAFVVLLNFPLTTLDERLKMGHAWTRRQWAEARLGQRFSKRVPAEVSQQVSKAYSDGESYIAEYNIWMHHLLDADGRRLFPKGLRLISHWNLRDELKADYADPNALAKQRMIQKVMERIVTQTIPAAVINLSWTAVVAEIVPPRRRPTVERLQNRGLDLDEVAGAEKLPHGADDSATGPKDLANRLVGD